MTEIFAFLKDNIDKVWTLLATLIGALISYKATTVSEWRKEKRAAQRERLKDILIPLCSDIEDAIDVMDQYKAVQLKDFDIKVITPSEYLKAEKRVYLSKNQRILLKQYSDAVQAFYKKWKEEQASVYSQYQNWVAIQMRDCPSAPSAMDVIVSMSIKATDIRKAVLERKAESYKAYVSSITYIINDEPEDSCSLSVTFDKKIKNLCGEIDYGITTIDDVEEQETRIACEVYDYFCGIDDKLAVKKIISETETNDKLFVLAAKAMRLRDCLWSDIDKVVG